MSMVFYPLYHYNIIMLLSDVIIVLCRPAEAGNAGAVCRAMKNMGLSRLRLVAPEFSMSETVPSEPPNPGPSASTLSEAGFGYGGNLAVLKARAVHAVDVWEKAEIFDTLHAAVKDCALVIGTTRRRGRRRKQVTMTPSETAVFLKQHPGPAALVFGNERTGLEDEEIDLCNMASHIPVDENFPSLNLSHAAQIYAYELFKVLRIKTSPACPDEEPVKGQWVPLDQEAAKGQVREIMDNLRILGFYKKIGREEQERFFRDIFSRAGLTEREGQYFSSIIARAVRLAIKE